MKFFTRQMIVCLLLLLQGFAPLVHAHVHLSDRSNVEGVHLPFQITAAAESKQSDVISLNVHTDLDTIIALKSGIKVKQRLKDSFDANYCLLLSQLVVLQLILLSQDNIIFPITDIPVISNSGINYLTPRAPPILFS